LFVHYSLNLKLELFRSPSDGLSKVSRLNWHKNMSERFFTWHCTKES